MSAIPPLLCRFHRISKLDS
uniref:Uncharacterized protein n=1 Tax=Anguilla anguilla TaxID=7936 RepID=A0A0E9V3Q3_ANGAN